MLTEEQKKNRMKGIGASESAIVLGISKWMSPYELWLIKTGRMEPKSLDDVPQVYWGNVHEDSIAKKYAEENNLRVRRVTETLYHKDYPFLLCHLDRKIEGQKKALECKFAMFHSDKWGESGSDVVPLSYIVQIQHQLAVTGYEEADLAVLIGGWDYRWYPFKRDEEIINKIIVECEKFWRLVETGEPPELRDRKDVQLAYPYSNGKFKEADHLVCDDICMLVELKNKLKKIQQEKENIEEELVKYIEDADGIKMNDCILATFKPTKKGKRVLRVMEK